MRKTKILIWHRHSHHAKRVKWSPFFSTPAQTDALLKPLFEPPSSYHITLHCDKDGSYRFSRNSLLLWLSVLIAAVLLSDNQMTFANNSGGNEISLLRSEALEAEGSGEFDRAESLYQKALTAARQSAARTKEVEFLSRIVQVRIENHKLLETDALVREAIQLAQSLKNTSAGDATLPVWMNDMADALYSKGEQTARDDIKEYCLRHYLDIKFAMTDTWDPQLICKCNLFTTYLASEGKYSEALPYVEREMAFRERTQPSEVAAIAFGYLALGAYYSAVNQSEQARLAFQKNMQMQSTIGLRQGYEALNARELGTLALQERNFVAARGFYNKAILEERNDKSTIVFDEFALGVLEQRANNFETAAQHYAKSLDCYDKCIRPAPSPLYPGAFDSVLVVASEHLVQVLQKSRETAPPIASFQGRAAKMRTEHPEWITTNPDPEKYFLIWWRLPFHIDMIPTRSVMPL